MKIVDLARIFLYLCLAFYTVFFIIALLGLFSRNNDRRHTGWLLLKNFAWLVFFCLLLALFEFHFIGGVTVFLIALLCWLPFLEYRMTKDRGKPAQNVDREAGEG